MNNSSKTESKSILPQALQFLKLSELITILSVFVFIPGFIIVSIYLAGLGIHDYSLLRIKYLCAGFLFTGMLAVYFLFVWRRIYYAEEDVGNIAITLINGNTSKFWTRFWGILSMIIVFADNAFGIVFATCLIGSILFPSDGTKIILGLTFLFFLIDYPLIKLGKYNKSPRIAFLISCAFHIISICIFFIFVKGEETRILFWAFFLITLAINLLLDQRKKLKSDSTYITKLFWFDWIWVIIFVIILSISFGKTLYEKINPGFGGGKPEAIKIMIDQKVLPYLKEIPIKENSNLTEKVFLLLETEKEIYIKFQIDNKKERVIQLNKQLIQGIIFGEEG